MYNQFGISDSLRRTDVTNRRLSIQRSRIADDSAELTGIAYITSSFFIVRIGKTPLVGIIEIEGALRYARCTVIYQCHFRFLIHFHFHTRQTGSTLRELHISAQQVDFEVVGQRKHETTRVEHEFHCT